MAKRRIERIWSASQSFIVAIGLALVFRQFVLQAFRIPSSSMEDTLLVGDFLFVNKFLYGAPIPFSDKRLPKVRTPHRGDIIVFKSPTDGRDFIKRCVGVAGDTLEVRNKELWVNGARQAEPFAVHKSSDTLLPGTSTRDFMAPYIVPPGYLFMMGDNRDNSHDSRFWGPLPLGNIKGKAMFIYFSWDREHAPFIRLRRFGRLIH